jgi:hypothetical protein
MSVTIASTIFFIAWFIIHRVSLHPWLIIELLPAFLGKTLFCQHRDNVLNTSVNGASMTFGLASWKLQGMRGDIELSSNCRPPVYPKMGVTTTLLCSNHGHQQSVKNFLHWILEKTRIERRHWPIIKVSAAVLGKTASVKMVTMFPNEPQWSVNDFWLCILDNLMAMEPR